MENEPLIEEAAGKDTVTPEQYGKLHEWDIFIEDIIPKLEEDKRKAHEITLFEMKQGEVKKL